MTIQINVTDNVKGLREILCEAQSLVSLISFHISATTYIELLQELIDELDKHRPLGPDGKHGDRHTATCGCEDKGHGDWCRKGIVGGNEFFESIFLCKHHGSWCDHSDCESCWRAGLRERKCLVCGHDWSIDEQKDATK
jgi:hypothetical protein